MSARDSASGSSDWKGGGGGMTANGGIGGGMGGGLGGGGAGRTGGYGGGLGGSRESYGGYKDGGLAAAVVPMRRRGVPVNVVPTSAPVRQGKQFYDRVPQGGKLYYDRVPQSTFGGPGDPTHVTSGYGGPR